MRKQQISFVILHILIYPFTLFTFLISYFVPMNTSSALNPYYPKCLASHFLTCSGVGGCILVSCCIKDWIASNCCSGGLSRGIPAAGIPGTAPPETDTPSGPLGGTTDVMFVCWPRCSCINNFWRGFSAAIDVAVSCDVGNPSEDVMAVLLAAEDVC